VIWNFFLRLQTTGLSLISIFPKKFFKLFILFVCLQWLPLTPGIHRISPTTITLNPYIINPSDYLYESLITPGTPPRIPHEPIFHAISCFSISNNGYPVLQLCISGWVVVDSSSRITDERVGDRDSTGNWAVLEFIDHVGLATDVAEGGDGVIVIVVDGVTTFLGVAIFALNFCRTSNPIIMTSRQIISTGLITNILIMNVLIRGEHIPSVASCIHFIT